MNAINLFETIKREYAIEYFEYDCKSVDLSYEENVDSAVLEGKCELENVPELVRNVYNQESNQSFDDELFYIWNVRSGSEKWKLYVPETWC